MNHLIIAVIVIAGLLIIAAVFFTLALRRSRGHVTGHGPYNKSDFLSRHPKP